MRRTIQTCLNEEKNLLTGLSEKNKPRRRPWKVQYDMYCQELMSQGCNKTKPKEVLMTLSKLQQQMIRQQCPNYQRA